MGGKKKSAYKNLVSTYAKQWERLIAIIDTRSVKNVRSNSPRVQFNWKFDTRTRKDAPLDAHIVTRLLNVSWTKPRSSFSNRLRTQCQVVN
jgi:hypothetical protein